MFEYVKREWKVVTGFSSGLTFQSVHPSQWLGHTSLLTMGQNSDLDGGGQLVAYLTQDVCDSCVGPVSPNPLTSGKLCH